ncbi:MAG: 4Fe-4S binding protein [Rhodobacteraceae bacterium]|nr:4Fe-4S binding protein [Paracoccaceae bacterium]
MTSIDRVYLCTCEGSMEVDPETARKATGAAKAIEVRALCDSDVDRAEAAAQSGTTLVACGQMTALFEEIWEDTEGDAALVTVDIRDRAGWTDAGRATAKQTALLAEAMLTPPTTPTRDIVSEGTTLILGRDEAALDVARALSERLAVTCILPSAPDLLQAETDFDLALGQLASASGALGAFTIRVSNFQTQRFGGRGSVTFNAPIESATSNCDIVIDLRGEGPLFPADHKREGYLRADPGEPLAVSRLVDQAAQYQGVFEQPLYIRYDETICAHSRASKTGCTRCLDVCPTGAILPVGDHVSIDPAICAGCGACAAVCPSGAASFDDPPVQFLFQRLRTLASTYREHASDRPHALFHDAYGTEIIALSARHGRGLPTNVIPVEVPNVEGVGHAELMAALGVGFDTATILTGPKSDTSVIAGQIELAHALSAPASGDRFKLVQPLDPDSLEAALAGEQPAPISANAILPSGGRRNVTRLAVSALSGDAISSPLPLPKGAPYGAVAIDGDACTLCLACVSLCPVGALGDSPDKPQVRFQETACLQCGICASACPETAISLVPQMNLSNEALTYRVLNEEDPFECIECGKPFGVKSTIERIVSKLEGNHWMYTSSDNSKLIQMCDDCRVNAQYHQENSPFAMGERPAVRTTDDYLKDRKPN